MAIAGTYRRGLVTCPEPHGNINYTSRRNFSVGVKEDRKMNYTKTVENESCDAFGEAVMVFFPQNDGN